MSGIELNALSPEQRDALILDHMGLLHHIVGQLFVDIPGGIEREDLEGYAMVGLIAAADSWDPSRGLKFSTFAYSRIRGSVLDELRRMDFLPRGRRERVRELDRYVQSFEQEHGGRPSPEQIATGLGITEPEVDEILQSARAAMRASLDDGPSSDLAGLVSDPRCEDPSGTAEWDEMRELLTEAIQSLPKREQSVITLYYAEDLLLKEIGEILEVTESRVSQIHSRALYRLNTFIEARTGST
ncbi:MAG: FliA/WhiG family RNA polymerase sigma factor [Planctomycetota bacterium]|nr:FliA/WhiG family RNA polymerase sigma factor [Planctomycetota bacterium]